MSEELKTIEEYQLFKDLHKMARDLEIVKHVLNELTMGSNAALYKICNEPEDE